MVTLLDVSHHQNDKGPLSWLTIAQGVSGVFVKATQGTGTVDPAHADNVAGARAAGLLVGHYHYAGNGDAGMGTPAGEAALFLAHADHQPGELLVLDYEPARPPIDPDGWCADFLEYVRAATGVQPLIYMNESTARARPWSRVLSLGTGLWAARYGPNDGQVPNVSLQLGTFAARLVAWQYTSAGRLAGVPGLVDLSLSYIDATIWHTLGGLYSQPPAPAPAATPPAPAAFDVAGFRLSYGQRSDRLPSLRRWANRMYPGYQSTPMDESGETNYGPQLVRFVAEFGARIGVPNDGRDIGPRIAAGLAAQGWHG